MITCGTQIISGGLVTTPPAGSVGTTQLADGAATLAKLDRTGASGRVLTAAGAGVAPTWEPPAGGLPLGTGFVTVSSGVGGVLTASTTSAADLRTALQVDRGVRAYSAADLTATQGHASTAASIVSGRLRLSIDAAERRYGTASGTWTATAPRGVLTLPSGVREVVVVAGVHSRTGAGSGACGVTVTLRGGGTSDPADVSDNSIQAGVRLPGTVQRDASTSVHGGETRADTYPAALSPTVSTASWGGTTPTARYGVRWTRGGVGYVAMAASGTGLDDVMGVAPAVISPDWPVPRQIVIALQQYPVGVPTAASVDLDIFVWVWT